MNKLNLWLIFLGGFFGGQLFAGDDRPVMFVDGDLRCKAENARSVIVRCTKETEVGRIDSHDIYDAMVKCSNQSQADCNANIAKFKEQINLKEYVWQHQGLFYIGQPLKTKRFGKSGDVLLPIELAVAAGMHKAVVGLLNNGANSSYQQPLCPKFTLMHHLANRIVIDWIDAQRLEKKGQAVKTNHEIELNGVEALPWGPAYASLEDDYLKIAKLLRTANGLKALSIKCYAGQTPVEVCGSLSGQVCDYLRGLAPQPKVPASMATKKSEAPKVVVRTVESALERNKRAMDARAKQYQKCTWGNFYFAYNKNKQTNDQLLNLLDAGYTICE